ncbi:MAG: ATP-binding protein [Clostridiales bacterium]|nr:ATP-binding protein [Clostridiales bacterium]
MDISLLRRNIENVVKDTLKDTPVAIIQGARQVGKSTLAMMVSKGMKHREVTLDSGEALLSATENPFEFVSQYQEGLLIIDEVQKCPDLLPAIKLSVDRDRRPGRFLITGSADILRVKGANESLAGRAETIWLEPFSVGEIKGIKEDFVTRILQDDIAGILQKAEPTSRTGYAGLIVDGGYPDAIDREGRRRRAYFRNYISRVLDHDANELSGLAHLDRLRKLYDIIIGGTSGIYVRANVSRLINIPESSMNGYIRLLKDLCLIHALPAWGKNYSRRAIGKPKIIVSDTGLACSLKGISHEFLSNIENGNEMGPLLETFVIAEINKQRSWSETDYSLHHYRDRDNKEVDIVLELDDGRLIAIEVKAASSFSRKDFSGMKAFRDVAGSRFYCGILLYTGMEAQPFGDKMFAAPVSAIWQ